MVEKHVTRIVQYILLLFIGVNAIKAGKFRKELADPDDTPANEKNPESEVKEDELERPTYAFSVSLFIFYFEDQSYSR